MSVMSCKLWSCPKRPFDPLRRRKAAMFFSLQWLGAQQSHPSLTGFSAESLRRQDAPSEREKPREGVSFPTMVACCWLFSKVEGPLEDHPTSPQNCFDLL